MPTLNFQTVNLDYNSLSVNLTAASKTTITLLHYKHYTLTQALRYRLSTSLLVFEPDDTLMMTQLR